MMLSRRLQETPGDSVLGHFHFLKSVLPGSNYSGDGNKEQGKKESFVRFSEQRLDITTVYRWQKGV
jgi:hypothetical protein